MRAGTWRSRILQKMQGGVVISVDLCGVEANHEGGQVLAFKLGGELLGLGPGVLRPDANAVESAVAGVEILDEGASVAGAQLLLETLGGGPLAKSADLDGIAN